MRFCRWPAVPESSSWPSATLARWCCRRWIRSLLAVNQDVGWYEERCRSCSSCVLGWTGGICPVTMCAKGLYNGPCGGTDRGKCEISQDQPCAWFMIFERLSLRAVCT